NYARTLVTVLGEDFSEVIPGDGAFNDGSIVIELGNNRIYTIQFGPPYEDGRRLARVFISGGNENAVSPHVYVMAEWTVRRLFRNTGFFESAE
ncbi:MAG: hypothetical protein LBG42_09360, partial [Treponema sp.]|nr:hypothetical protein [Treponema sp.]